MLGGVLKTYQLKFVFMVVVPDSHPFSLFIKKRHNQLCTLLEPLTSRLEVELTIKNIKYEGSV